MADILSSLSQLGSEIISAIPSIVLAIIIIVIAYFVGKGVGRGVERILLRSPIERVIDTTEIGRAYRQAGLEYARLVGNLIWAFIAILGVTIALSYISLSGTVIQTITTVATYLLRIVGAIIVLVLASPLFEILATFIARQLSVAIPRAKSYLLDLIKSILYVGLIAFLLYLVFGILEIPGQFIYPLILGIVAIAIGIAVSETLVNSIADEHPEFRQIAGYAKFLIILIFLIIGVSGIFGYIPGTITVIQTIAWSVAIAAALLIVPIIYYLAKKIVAS